MPALGGLGFIALWRPDLMLGALVVGALYLRGLVPERANARRVPLFALGLLALYGAYGTPLAAMAGHWLFSARVAQDVLVAFVAAPLLLGALPPRWLRAAVRRPPLRAVVATLTRPVVAILVFHAILGLDLASPVVGLLRAHPWLMPVDALVLLLASIEMWWPLMVDLPEVPQPAPGVQLLYLFVNWLLITLAFAVLTFGDGLPYTAYAAAPGAFGLTPRIDRQLGGVVLGGLSHVAYLIALGSIFLRWARQESLTAHPARVYSRLRGAGLSEDEAREIAGLGDRPR